MTTTLKARIKKLESSVAWDGNYINVTDPAIMSMIDKQFLSPSTNAAMHGCSALFAARKALPDVMTPISAMAKGNSVHAVLEAYYTTKDTENKSGSALVPVAPKSRTKVLLTRLVDELLEKEKLKDPEFFSVKENETLWTTEVLAGARNIWDAEDPKSIDVIQNERSAWGAVVGSTPFAGKIDRLDRLPNGLVRVTDYKTGKHKKPWQYGTDAEGDQQRAYAQALKSLDGQFPGEAQLIYLGGKGVAQPVDLSDTQMTRTLKDFDRGFELLRARVDSNAFPTKASVLCGWCPLVNVCPSAQAEGKTDRTPERSALLAKDVNIPTATAPVKETKGKKSKTKAVAASSAPKKKKAKKDKAKLGVDETPATITPDDPWVDDALPTDDSILTSEAPEKRGPLPWEDDEDMAKETIKHKGVDFRNEDKPYYETARSFSGEELLNLNSYAAGGVFGVVSLAMALLAQAGAEPTGARVKSLSLLLAEVIEEAQKRVTLRQEMDWQAGINTRLRGALRSTIETGLPVPLGGSAKSLRAWQKQAVTRIVGMTNFAENLWAGTLTGDIESLVDIEVREVRKLRAA